MNSKNINSTDVKYSKNSVIEKFPEYLDAFNELKLKIKGVKINSGTLINIVRYAMEIVEITKVKGSEQKRMVIELLRDLFDGDENDLPIPDDAPVMTATRSAKGPLIYSLLL